MISQEALDYFTQLIGLNFQVGKNDIESVEDRFLHFKEQFPNDVLISFYYNEFRIANSAIVKKIRPQILLGSGFESNFPNLHSYPLLEIADVVCLTCNSVENPSYAVINCNPTDLFFNILKRLPEGFKPDFYLDHQVEKGHFIPQGIEIAPFPILATVCHSFFHKSIEHICYLFDKVLPLSKFHAELLRKKFPEKVLELPFGLNWASFDYFIKPLHEKTVDVALTFDATDAPAYGNARTLVAEKIEEFKSKHGDRYNIVISPNLPFEQYIDLIQKSLIVINVTGIHGPYNYRTIETMCSGSLVFQYDWNDSFFENKFEGVFKEGEHGIGFTLENLEEKLFYFLEHKKEALKIAENGLQFLKTFNYVDLYSKLVNEVKQLKIERPRPLSKAIGYHHLDMIYFNQADLNLNALMLFGSLNAFCSTPWIKYNNMMVASALHSENSLSELFLQVLLIEELMAEKEDDLLKICKSLYNLSLKNTPTEFKWIVEWNYLQTLIEQSQATDHDFKRVLKLLENVKAIPFEEEKVIFKYMNFDYFDLNIALMKHIDQPLKRAESYLEYARAALLKSST